jgi:hypothetical protein
MCQYKFTGNFICFDKRICKTCKVEKDLNVTNFELRNSKTGRMSLECKPCVRIKINKRHSKPEVKNRLKEKARKLADWQREYHKTDKARTKARQYRQSEHGRALRKSLNAKRRAVQIQRTPKWADINAITEFYRNCPKGYHVDHIVPLQGKNVCGLHTLENLQYLTASENCSKRNKF